MTDTTQPPAETLTRLQKAIEETDRLGGLALVQPDDLRAILAALTRRAGGDAIPAGMKPWHGGEGPPHDWNREQAMRRDGQLEMARDIMQAQWWGSNDDWDIIAYTPKQPAGGDAGSASGTFACPICGEDTPHHHTPPVVDAYQTKGSRK